MRREVPVSYVLKERAPRAFKVAAMIPAAADHRSSALLFTYLGGEIRDGVRHRVDGRGTPM